MRPLRAHCISACNAFDTSFPQVTIHTAVCDKQRMVHYVDGDAACSGCTGIAELIPQDTLKREHPSLAAKGFQGA